MTAGLPLTSPSPARTADQNSHASLTTPYSRLGGERGVNQLADRFYTLMDELPEAWAIRQIHPTDLSSCKPVLAQTLGAWLGGPAKGAQTPSHAQSVPLSAGAAQTVSFDQLVDEWLLCMRMALSAQTPDAGLHQAVLWAMRPLAIRTVRDATGR